MGKRLTQYFQRYIARSLHTIADIAIGIVGFLILNYAYPLTRDLPVILKITCHPETRVIIALREFLSNARRVVISRTFVI